MSKKDYQLIARLIASIADDHVRWTVGDAFAKVLKEDNPRFNIATFKRACWGHTRQENITLGSN